MESLYGKDFADMQRKLGQQDLFETLKELGDTNPDTRLKLSLEGRDPDDGVTDIAYEKGNNLMVYDRKYKDVYISNKEIWSFLDGKFDLTYPVAQAVTKKWLDEFYNLRGITTKARNVSGNLFVG